MLLVTIDPNCQHCTEAISTLVDHARYKNFVTTFTKASKSFSYRSRYGVDPAVQILPHPEISLPWTSTAHIARGSRGVAITENICFSMSACTVELLVLSYTEEGVTRTLRVEAAA